jgi:O-antigen/teichoic acid export membrane protein
VSSAGVGMDAAVGTAAPDLLDTPAAGPAAVRGGVLQTLSWFGGTVVGVASGAILVRHLGVIETGRYTVAVALIAIVSGVTDLGLTAVSIRELSILTGAARNSFARNLLGIRLVLSAVGVTVATLFAFAAGYGSTLTLGVALAGIALILQSAQSMMGVSLVSELRLGVVAALAFLRAVLTAGLVVALVLLGAHLLAFLAATIPVSIIVLAINARVVYGKVPLQPAFRLSQWKPVIRDVLPYSLAAAAATVYFYLAVLLVSLLASGKTLGYFSVSVRVIQVLILMPGLAIGAAFPIFSRAARDDHERLAYAVGRVVEVCLLAGVLVALCLAIGASIAVLVVAGHNFGPAAPLLAIQGVGLGASFLGAVWANALLSLHRYREILKVNLFALIFGGGLVALLVSVDGAHGAAIGTAVTEFVGAALNGTMLARVDPAFRPPLRIVPGVALAAGLAVASTVLRLPVLASVTLAAAIYVVVVLALGLVPEELLEHIPGRRRTSLSSP